MNDKNCKSTNARQSNIEAVRVVAMSMILIWHFYCHGGLDSIFDKWFGALVIYGVDLFVLISGFFLIKIRWESVLKLVLVIGAFEAISLILGLSAGVEFLDRSPSEIAIHTAFAPFSGSSYWFVKVYFILILLSPALNIALKNFSRHNLRLFIGMLSIAEFYSCWIMSNNVHQNGYGIFNFIYLYVLGYYISQEKALTKIPISLIFTILCVCIACNSLMFQHCSDPYPASYQSIFTVAIAAAIVLLFYRHPFQSKFINALGACSFGVYLLQEGSFGKECIYVLQSSEAVMGNLARYFLISSALFVGFWVASWAIMKLLNTFVPQLSKAIANHIPNSLKFDFNQKKRL